MTKTSTIPQFGKGARITGATRAAAAGELVDRYENGASVRALAELYGRSYGWVHRMLTEFGVQFRPRGGATRTRDRHAGS